LVQHIDLGTTAHLFVVENGDERQVLKTPRDGESDTAALRVEHQVLRYLNATVMQQYVPRVGEWVQELDGFQVEYLRYPTLAERNAKTWRPHLAQALQALHGLRLPVINGIADDRPEIGVVISSRFRSMFQHIQEEDTFWTGLPREDKSKLECVRGHYPTYIGLLQQIEDLLAPTKPALTHGDLAGDNIMLTQDGRLAIADWGATRISSALTDVAHLLAYANWPQDEERRFLSLYFSDDRTSLEETLPSVQMLSRLYRYHSCVQSLLWLNEKGKVGLDAVGRVHLERMLGTL
jgi:Ser/Thr protein kinase RdoA (MazF antagonist)